MEKPPSEYQSQNDQAAAAGERAARVQALKEAVAAGIYQVDERALADSLLSHLLWEEWENKRSARP